VSHVKQKTCQYRTQSSARGTEKNNNPEQGAMSPDTEQFHHDGRDGRKKSAMGNSIDTGKQVKLPQSIGFCKPNQTYEQKSETNGHDPFASSSVNDRS
jgi:hypothetical protein